MFAISDYHELRRRITRTVTRALLRQRRGVSRVESVPGTAVHRILVCRPNHRLGNLVLLTPLLQELERALPAAQVDVVLAGRHGAELFRTYRNVARLYTLSRRMVRHPWQTARIAFQIRRARYDLVIDPCSGSQSSRWLTAIAGATHVVVSRADEPGVDGGGAADAGPEPAPAHMAKWPVHQLRRALAPGGAGFDSDYPALDIRLSRAEQQRGQHILDVLLPSHASFPEVVGVFADARGAKRYPEAWWMYFIERLRVRVPGSAVVEIAPPDGHSRLSSRFPVFFSPDIREVAAVISQMACFVSADCGVMHLACASGIPTVGLFSVTDIAKYGPYAHGSCAVDTNGKSPEEVAQLVASILGTARAEGDLAAPAPPASHASGEREGCVADGDRTTCSRARA